MQWKVKQRMANLMGIDKTCCRVIVQRSSPSDLKGIENRRATLATYAVRNMKETAALWLCIFLWFPLELQFGTDNSVSKCNDYFWWLSLLGRSWFSNSVNQNLLPGTWGCFLKDAPLNRHALSVRLPFTFTFHLLPGRNNIAIKPLNEAILWSGGSEPNAKDWTRGLYSTAGRRKGTESFLVTLHRLCFFV